MAEPMTTCRLYIQLLNSGFFEPPNANVRQVRGLDRENRSAGVGFAGA
jgi:hypothetical protein